MKRLVTLDYIRRQYTSNLQKKKFEDLPVFFITHQLNTIRSADTF